MRKLSLIALFLLACDSPDSNPGTTDVSAPDGADTTPSTAGDTFTPQDTNAPPADTSTPPADTSTPPADTSTPPADTTAPPADTTAPPADTAVDDTGPGDTSTSASGVGAACADDGDCGAGAVCITDLPGGYCSVAGCDTNGCPEGASCWGFGEAGSYCLKDCAAASECRGGDGYVCDADNTCWPPSTASGDSPVGGPCESDADCKDAGAFCYPAEVQGEQTGFFQGYCMIADCTADSCPAGSTCQAIFSDGSSACVDACGTAGDGCNQGYGCFEPGICFPSCQDSGCPDNFACDAASDSCVPSCSATSCPAGTVCRADGTCGEPPCTANSCGAGYVCAQSGECVPDLAGGPGPGPGPTCNALPPRDCTEGNAACGQIVAFEPDEGPGYWDYPINGETTADEYRSYARKDLMMLIKWATATVDCKAAAWDGGNGEPLGLGDMSEATGDIPGTREGEPGHPDGTHVDGNDMDIGYFQTGAAPDNRLRPICPHTSGGQDAYHCTGAPNTLDVWRTAFFIGLLLQSPRTRVIGVDGKVGPLVEEALDVLCGNGWLDGTPCTQNRALAYEVTNQQMGWYYFHHHHLHISLKYLAPAAPSQPGAPECLVPGCNDVPGNRHGDGMRDRPHPLTRLERSRLPR